MKKVFEDKSFLEIIKINNKVQIIVGAKDSSSINKMIINCVEIDIETFDELIKNL